MDQFIHHYVYDADNRIQFVETSRDSLFWERDANYEYYLHGPMGRTEIGERRVQGLDYAYTLQGWLKGVNASALSLSSPGTADFTTRDMGRDGKSGNTGDFARNKKVGRDAMAFTLGYYYGDYRMVSTTSGDAFEMKYANNADFHLASSSLYNGNIRHAVYTIAQLNVISYARPEGYTYKYDQLNRLIGQRTRINYDLSGYEWSTTAAELERFREDVAYDPNGNILKYLRNGHRSSQYLMDSLTYHYQANTNKLNYIDDKQTGALSVYKGDLKDQAPNNYAYDAIGNLIQDTRDSITSITWTNAQKIDSIAKTDRSIWFGYDAMQNRVVKHSKANSSDQEKRTYYIRDAQGNIMATYQAYVTNDDGVITWDSVRLSEQHIYGSTRVGMTLPNVQLYPLLQDTNIIPIFAGSKRYELTNHLGNVLVVLSDRKHGKAASGSDIQWFDADVLASQQYYPFGMLMPDTSNVTLRRQYRVGGYDHRFGFNGKEGDDEVKGDDNQQDYGMRIYDPRVGRFLSVDPIAKEYPELTPYQFASNTPIQAIDLDGLEKLHYILTFLKNGKPVLKLIKVEPNIKASKSPIPILDYVTNLIIPETPIIVDKEEHIVHNYLETFDPFGNRVIEKVKTYDTYENALINSVKDLEFSSLEKGLAYFQTIVAIGSFTTATPGKVFKPIGKGIYIRSEGGRKYVGKQSISFYTRYKNRKKYPGVLDKGADMFLEVKGDVSDGLLKDVENAIIDRNGGPMSSNGKYMANKYWARHQAGTPELQESIKRGVEFLDQNLENWREIFDFTKK